MKKFETQMKLYVLDSRKARVEWKTIVYNFKQKFGIDPPSIRAMQKWEALLDRTVLTAELMKDLDKKLPQIEKDSQLEIAQNLIPILWKAQEEGQNSSDRGWIWFFGIIEGQLGKDRFKRLINEYFSESEKRSSTETKEVKNDQ